MKQLILTRDYAAIRKTLSENPKLANEGWPYDDQNPQKAHPLHRLCDLVFAGMLTEDEAVEMATLFLESGANVNGYPIIVKRDTPLLAACSLHADQLALLYMDRGADIHHQGAHGGTALHWAAWCGRDILVEKLINEGAEINKRCIDFQATPLFWAVLSYIEKNDPYHQPACIKMLLTAGADPNIPNGGGKTIDDMAAGNTELKALFP